MKRIFTLVGLTLFFSLGANAQRSYVNYNKDSRWFIGLNGGATWHTRTEVDNLIHGGYGFTFGRSFGMKPEKLFSWDLRFRYLHGWWGGQATEQFQLDSNNTNLQNYPTGTMQTYSDTLGYFVPNFRSQLLSGSLELALNTNRLRENTGWNIQIFGGIGAKGYNTRADLTDGSGQIYDYNNISLNKADLLSSQDGIYESNITGTDDLDFEWDWAGSFGAGISYQVTPWAAIGISHKMTWTRNNEFDLMPNDITGIPTGKNDIYHYSSAGIRFHLFGGNYTAPIDPIVEDTTNVDVFDTVDPIVDQPPVQRPIVDIYDPGVSPYTTENSYFLLKAYVHHVDGRGNITFKQNGNINNNFSYNAASDKFQSNVILQPGQNIFEITGVNNAGQDYESTIIIYKVEEPVIEPPIVTITNPPYSPYTTNNNVFNFAGTVLNVDSKSQIKVYFNGTYLPNFTYSTSSKALYATLNLQEGTNTVTVTATNKAGSDSKTAKIIYEKPEVIQPPIVNYIVPSTDPHVSTTPYFNVTASVLNVDSKNDIIVEVNGHPTSNFNYNSTSKNVTFTVALLEGANVIRVTGSNQAGVDQETTTIIYKKPEAPKPPIVTFIDPGVDPITVYNTTYHVEAKVLNVNSASDITLKINGVQSYNFNYSTSSKIMKFSTNLLVGSNVIEITGTNNVGSDQETTTIIYRKIVPQSPPVVNITYPAQDNQIFNTPNINLISSVLNVSSAANIKVWVNNNLTSNFYYNTSTKVLTLPLYMVEGTNTVKITGTNTAGSDTDIRKIIYRKPVVPAPPTVDFVNPPTSPHQVTTEAYQISATTTNIDSKSQITFLHNGILVADNQYTFTSSHQVVYNAQLIPGSNVFDITVTNSDGTADDMAIVTYKIEDEPCIIPTVGYISPVPYSTVSDPNIIVDAQINNHSQETVVEMLLNGVSQGFMTYNANTSIASLPAVLNEGSNAITVIVTNNCGTNQATFTLNYVAPEAPCVDPTVFTSLLTTQSTQDETISLIAGVSDVASQSDITVTVNGNNQAFTFDQGTQNVNINNIPLSLGNNAIIVTATNECGTASITFHVQRKPCNLPAITDPSHQTGFTSENASLPFSVKVSNAIGSQIQVVINNISQPFTFNATTGVVSAGINLQEGANTIMVVATNSCGTASETYSFTYKIPCEEITYSLLNPSALTATVTDENYNILLHVNGTIEASGITATHNGNAIATSFDAVAGNVSINGITLVDGANTIEVVLKNACSEIRVAYTITYNGCQPPVINFSNVTEGAIFSEGTIVLSAIVQNSNGADNISLKLNGVEQSFDFNDQNNVLTSTLNLVEGNNAIQLSVNGCETKTGAVNLIYQIPCEPISYSLMQPSNNVLLVTESDFDFTINLIGVDNAQQISVMHNGNAHPFNYNAGSQILSVDGLTLTDGENGIVVTASNDCSSESIVYEVEYNGCQPPAVTLGSNPNVSFTPLYEFNASVTNISQSSDIVVLLNGAPVQFIFDQNSGSITGEATLIEGTNTIKVIANGCESDDKEFTVNYEIPCDPIVYSFATPSQLETSVADETYTISLVAQNADQNSITVQVNGAPSQFTYANDIITIANIQLNDGANTITVTMNNECSSETITYTVNHDGCDAPIIDISGNADAVQDMVYNLEAHIANAGNQNEITVKLNGQNVPFTFDSGTGEVAAALQLTEGANAITIAANTCASATETFNVTYTIPCFDVTYTLASPTVLSSVVETNTTSITLNVSNVESETAINATVNGQSVPVTFSNGMITIANIPLNEGSNVILVTFGNDCSSETLEYRIESDQCETPIISVANANIVTNDPIYTFTCNVANIENGSDLSVAVNGQVVTHNFANGVLTAQMTLQEGANSVQVTANGCETTSITYQITYEIPCSPITFTYQMPTTNNDTIYQEVTNLVAKILAQNVEQAGITATLNGNPVNFTFFGGSVQVMTQSLQVGNNSLIIHMSNECSEAEAIWHIVVGTPCQAPVISFGNSATTVDNGTYSLSASVSNVSDAADLVVKLNNQSVPFTYNAGNITASMALNQGANVIKIEAVGCESSTETMTVTFTPPCDPVTYNLIEPATQTISTENGTYSIELNTEHVTNPATVTATVNGTAATAQYDGQNGHILLNNFNLNPGANTVVINFANDCSNKTVTYTVTYNEPAGPCGPRFNPGNSEWEFCLITPDGTSYNRDDLANNSNFTYSGPATSAYFKPIAGGGDATVGGQPYTVQNGKYYLFQGNLTVDVSSSHPGSMGHWEICIQSDNAPTFGNGNNRPTSPCEGGSNNSGGGPDFNIQGDGTVHVNENVCATIKCLGESVVYNNQQDAFVKVQYSVDGGSSYFHFNGSNNVSGGETVTVQASSGSDIVLKSICTNEYQNWTNTEISNTGSQYVYVLKDGDQAPDFAPAQGQASVETFLAGYVDGQGNVTLGPNEVIYLFELRFVGNYGIDYQDCVMLVSLAPGDGCPAPSDPVGKASTTPGQVWTQPTFENVMPQNLSSTSTTPNFNLQTKVRHVNDLEDLKLLFNNAPIRYSYDFKSKVLSASLKLVNGDNKIRIEAANGNKSNQVTYTVNYKGPENSTSVAKPVIVNSNPKTTSSTVNSSTFSFKAKVENVKSQSDITLSLNGQSMRNFSYLSATKQVSAVLRLKDGVNTIKIVAKNGAVSAERTYTVNYKRSGSQISTSGAAPTITNLAPTTTSAKSATSTYSFKAKVKNVSSKSGIKLYMNGRLFTAFSFTSSTGQVTAVLKLNSGNNTIKLVAENGGKKVERTYTISYATSGGSTQVNTNTTKPKPVITNINPRGSSANVSSATYQYKAKVSNVSSKSNLTLMLNGRQYTAFTFSSASGQISAVLKLRSGKNTISLKAVNGNQVDQKTYTVTYTPKVNTNTQIKPNNSGGGTQIKPNNSGGGTKTNTGGTKTNTGGTKTSTGGTKTTTGGTKTTTGGTKTTTGGTKTTTGGTKTTTGGTKTTTGGTKTTTGRSGG